MRPGIILFIIIFGLNCTKESNNYLKPQDFYPASLNNHWIYEIDSLTFDVGPTGVIKRQVRSFLRETLRDTFTDGAGQTAYIISRESSSGMDGPWDFQGQDILQIKPGGIEKVENNLRFLKLKFPIRKGMVWNGNIFIDPQTKVTVEGEPVEMYKSWIYTYPQVDFATNLGNQAYDHVLKLDLANSENKIELRKAFELYAHEVGLIYREYHILDTQNISEAPWDQKAEKGFILRQTLITFN